MAVAPTFRHREDEGSRTKKLNELAQTVRQAETAASRAQRFFEQ